MNQLHIDASQDLTQYVGSKAGPSDWREVTQEMIDRFAEISGDDQWIHCDVERAAEESPFGTTIAHGNLTLSMADGFRKDLVQISGAKLGINYGWNKVRFPAPVPAGSRLRASTELISMEDLGGGWWHSVTRFTIEREDGDKPVCVADSVTRLLSEAPAQVTPGQAA